VPDVRRGLVHHRNRHILTDEPIDIAQADKGAAGVGRGNVDVVENDIPDRRFGTPMMRPLLTLTFPTDTIELIVDR